MQIPPNKYKWIEMLIGSFITCVVILSEQSKDLLTHFKLNQRFNSWMKPIYSELNCFTFFAVYMLYCNVLWFF